MIIDEIDIARELQDTLSQHENEPLIVLARNDVVRACEYMLAMREFAIALQARQNQGPSLNDIAMEAMRIRATVLEEAARACETMPTASEVGSFYKMQCAGLIRAMKDTPHE